MTRAIDLAEVIEQIVLSSCEDSWAERLHNRKLHLVRWRAVSKLWNEICDAYLFATVSYAVHKDQLRHWDTRVLLGRIVKARPERYSYMRSLTVLWDATWTSAYGQGLQAVPTWLPQCSGLTELIVHSPGGLLDMANDYAQNPFTLPNLRILRVSICVSNAALETFLASLKSLRTFRIMFDCYRPSKLGEAARRVARLLKPVAGQITSLEVDLSSCVEGKSTDLQIAFQGLDVLEHLLIATFIPNILDHVPASVRRLEIRTCKPTIRAMMLNLADPSRPLDLTRAPVIYEIADPNYLFEPKVTRALIDRGIRGFHRKTGVSMTADETRIWYRTVNAADD